MPCVPTAPLRTANATDMLPDDFDVLREIGRGANNRVLLVYWEGEERVLRVPRRGSDTQCAGSCKWEYLHTKRASELGVAPAVHAVWFSRHAHGGWPSGLYVVMERFDCDLDDFFKQERRTAAERAAVREGVLRALTSLAQEGLFLFDLKASNVVLRLDGEGGADVRMIDYGRDFCEWRCAASEAEVDVRTPTLDLLGRLVARREDVRSDEEAAALRAHVLFVTMLVQLSATMNRHLYEDRHEHRMGKEERRRTNPVTDAAEEVLSGMQGQNVALVRALLRSDDVRSVLRHYHGRRNAGTGRTIAFAVGEKT